MKKTLIVSSIAATIVGVILIAGGAWGIFFTYTNVAQENITTPQDASLPNKPVRGPFTLKAQADIIKKHTLRMTDGKTFAEMPRQIPKLDDTGQPVMDPDGKPMMTSNVLRDTWVTATTLITALHLGILTYVFSGIILLFGFISLWTGIVFWVLSRSHGK